MRILKVSACLVFALIFVISSFFSSNRVKSQTGASTLSAPTGLTASDNSYANKVGLFWDTIRGAASYRIFRNTVNNSSTATDIGTTLQNSFLDLNAPAGQTLFYWVRSEKGSIISDFSTVDQGSRANVTPPGGPLPLEAPPVPQGNPITATKTYLGKALFWDEQMSSTMTVSCGTCHHSANGGTDNRSVPFAATSINPGLDQLFGSPDDVRGSAGVPSNNADGSYTSIAGYGLSDQVTGRKTVSYVNAGYSQLLFWDGRASGTFRDPLTNAIVLNNGGALESQVLGPPVSSAEMAHSGRDWNDVASRIAVSKPLALAPSMPAAMSRWINGRTYPELFQEAFGTPEVTPTRIALAIATFERTLYSDRSPFDLDASGITPMTQQEQRGRGIFNASGCNTCHGGPTFSDNQFHFIGVRPPNEDTGRFHVTGNNQNIGEFKTPSLRNVELRGSYFHNGQFTTLEQVVAFYNRGGDFDAPNKPPTVRPLNLNQQQQTDLVAFLKRPLTDPRVAGETERFDRPALYMESNRVPVVSGSGRAGSGAVTPQIRAISPPMVGNSKFTISLSGALGNSNAVLVVDESDPGVGPSIPLTGSFSRVSINTQNTGAGNGWASVVLQIPDSAALVGKNFFARWYVQDAGAANGFSVSPIAKFTVFGNSAAPTRAKFDDFDGDGKTDISVFRVNDGNWYILRSGDSTLSVQHYGIPSDKLTPADYDGDGKTDLAVFRDGIWFLNRSRDGESAVQFGQPGDIPQPGDYDGDGAADIAVYRPSNGIWYEQRSRDGFQAVQYGIPTDKPVASDYDGDGRTDPAVYRDGVWFILKSTTGNFVVQFGLPTDKTVFGDYDGDGKSDIAVWRPSNGVWFVLRSSDNGVSVAQWGVESDIPSFGDYDGDGSFDYGIYRPTGGIWFIQNGTSGSVRTQQFGINTDLPVPSTIVP